MYLVDTNVLSETRKARPHGAVIAWLREIGERNLHISAVTIGELQTGIEIAREQDPARAEAIQTWAEQIARTWNVLPMDAIAFRIWAKLMHRRSGSLAGDAMIAATAIQHQLIVVTRNVRDFRDFDVKLFNPFAIARPSP